MTVKNSHVSCLNPYQSPFNPMKLAVSIVCGYLPKIDGISTVPNQKSLIILIGLTTSIWQPAFVQPKGLPVYQSKNMQVSQE